jgi:large subunit ribosomal protein L2
MGAQLPATLLQFFKVWKPRTPGLRNKRLVRTDDLYQGAPIPSLLTSIHTTGGRCRRTGRITTLHRGGGDKHELRLIDWDRKTPGEHVVMRIEQDPTRSARIALLKHASSNRLSYILAPKGTRVGDVVSTGSNVPPERGNCLPLSAIPPGSLIHSIGLRAGEGGKIARAAGMLNHCLYKN